MEASPSVAAKAKSSWLCGESYPLHGEFLLHRIFEKLANDAKVGDRIALHFDGVDVTFGQLNQHANRLASRLAQVLESQTEILNSDGDKIVAVCLNPSIDLIASLLAIFKIGAAYLPLDPSYPANRVTHILNDAHPALLLTTAALLEDGAALAQVADAKVSIFDLDKAELDHQIDEDVHVHESTARTLASVLYTSGSTGTPKGVRLEHRNIYHRLHWQWRRFPYAQDEMGCFKTALTFVDSIAEIWAPLLVGIPIVIIPKHVTQNTEHFVDLLDRFRVTRLVLVPSLLRAILTYVKFQMQCNSRRLLQSLHLWVCSGEILTSELLIRFYDCFEDGTTICNFYGSTEVMGDVTYAVFHSRVNVLESLVDNKVPIGQPLDNNAVYLLNPSKEMVEMGQIGELYVAGSHVAAGYVNKREMDRFIPNTIDTRKGYGVWFKTGDHGRIVNGTIIYEGRSDSQVKIRGHRVDLTEVNHIVHQMKEVTSSVVLCYKAGEPEQELVAFVVPNQTDVAVIKNRLKERLLSYMMPQVVEVESLPLLVNGKVDRQKLLALFAERLREEAKVALPDMDMLNQEERALLKTVASVVGSSAHKPIQLKDNFFDVGGNSLNAVTVVTKMRDQGYNLDITSFLSAKELAHVVLKLRQHCEHGQMGKYFVDLLSDAVKDDVIRMICVSFSEKAELELLTGVTYEDYDEFMNELWEPLVAAKLSFVVKDEKDRNLAVALNFDVFDEPVVQPRVQRLAYVFDFLESIEAPVRAKHFETKRNHLVHSFMMATHESLTPAENVTLIQFMEQETLKLAKHRGFVGVFTSNTNELTRQICDDILHYRVLSEVRINEYVHPDGTRPFAKAPDNQYSVVTVKYIDD